MGPPGKRLEITNDVGEIFVFLSTPTVNEDEITKYKAEYKLTQYQGETPPKIPCQWTLVSRSSRIQDIIDAAPDDGCITIPSGHYSINNYLDDDPHNRSLLARLETYEEAAPITFTHNHL